MIPPYLMDLRRDLKEAERIVRQCQDRLIERANLQDEQARMSEDIGLTSHALDHYKEEVKILRQVISAR